MERFWSKVDVRNTSKCWPWRAYKDKDGYGMFLLEGKSERSHRIALFLRTGNFPKYACHKCDNPTCCNPDHIYDGSHAENMRDAKERKRFMPTRGSKHYSTSLTDAKVKAIREEYSKGDSNMLEVAKMFGCSQSAVQRVVSRTTWKDVA